MEFERSVKSRRRLNLTPLIDVIFLLIVFFLLTSEFATIENISLSVSAVEEGEDVMKSSADGSILVVLERGGVFVLDNERYDLSSLRSKLEGLILRNQGRDVVIKSTAEVSVQDVVTAMDQVKAAGGRNISLAQEG